MKNKAHKIYAFLLILCMLAGLLPGNVFAAESPVEPEISEGVYQISTAAELLWFQQQVNNGASKQDAVLTDNIDLSTVCSEMNGDWTPIGASSASKQFKGIFDGQGYTITNIYIGKAKAARQGLFGTTAASAEIRNLGIKKATVKADTSANAVNNYNMAALVGYNQGTVSNCFVEASNVTTKSNTSARGALVCGWNTGTIENSYCISSTVTEFLDKYQIGGICAYLANPGKISNCYTADIRLITESADQIGPIFGFNNNNLGTIENCYYLATDRAGTNVGITGITSWTQEQFKSPEAITKLGEAFTFREGENGGYPVLTVSVPYVDKTTLSAIIAEAAAISNSGIYYTENDRYNGKNINSNGFWTDFQTALTSAGTVNAHANSRQDAVNAAAEALTSAAVKLIPKANINTTDLYEELQRSNPKVEGDYTAVTWPAFEAARTTAQTIFEQLYEADRSPTPYNSSINGSAKNDVDSSTAALTAARENLLLASDSTGYPGVISGTKEKINALKEIISRNPLQASDYTEASWSSYQDALSAAEQVPVLTGTASDGSKVNAYKAAYTALYQTYYGGLQPVGEITAELSFSDRITSDKKTYKGKVKLQGDTLDSYSLNTLLVQRSLPAGQPGTFYNIYINGIYLDDSYNGYEPPIYDGGAKRPPDLSKVILHPNDKISILWGEELTTTILPTTGYQTANFGQFEDSLKTAGFKQSDGITVEAGQTFILEVAEVPGAFSTERKQTPGEGMSLYISDLTTTTAAICPVTKPAAVDGEAIITDVNGKAALALYEEGWHLVAAYDMRADLQGNIPNGGGEATKGMYHSVNSGALIWVYVTPSSNPAAVKSSLKSKLDAAYNEYPESYFRDKPLSGLKEEETGAKNSWNNLKTAYDTAVAGITTAATIGDAYIAQNTGIVAIKVIQKDATEENVLLPDKLRGLLGRLPDDRALITKSIQGLVDSIIKAYDSLSAYQKTRLSTMEIDTCEMLILLVSQDGGLPAAKTYSLTYQISADTADAVAAIEDMIGYLQSNNTIKWWGQHPETQAFDLKDNQGNDDADKLLQFNATKRNAVEAAPDASVVLPIDIGQYAYLHVRETPAISDVRALTIPGAKWTISDESFELEDLDSLDYHVSKNFTVTIDGTEYELKSIEYQGIEEQDVSSKTAPSFIDKTTYKGRPVKDSRININFPDSQLVFTMPYNDVKIVFHWGTVGSADDLAAAREAAISNLQDKYDSFDQSKYDKTGKEALLAALTAGITKISLTETDTLSKIAEAKREALAAMMAVKPKDVTQLPPGAVLPQNQGSMVGQVKISVRNDTYKGGYFTGKLLDGWYDLYEKDTMMTAILKALAIEGYTWSDNDKKTGGYDYGISYIASIEKGGKKLAQFSGEAGSGWMGTLNDWFVNEGFQAFAVKDRKLENGDVIEVQYTQNLGEDLGGKFKDSNTSLKALSVLGGTLVPSFKESIKEYTLLIDSDRASVTLTPTASNKNYLVKAFLNYYDRESAFYKRTESISVKNGDVIYVGVGESSWPSMNNQTSDAIKYTGTKYILNVKKSGADTVNALIMALTDASRITYSNYLTAAEKIKAARTAYDALSDKSGVTNYAKLTAAEAKIKYYEDIDSVKALLGVIPSASKITLSHKQDVMAADTAYKKLDADQKKYITVGDVANYNAAIDRLTELGAFKGNETPSKIKGTGEIPKEDKTVYLQPVTVITGNTAKAKISEADAKQALEDLKAQEGNELLIQPKLEKAVSKLTVELPKTLLKEISEETKAVVTVTSNVAEITLSKDALKTIVKETGDNVSIIAEKLENPELSKENKTLVGSNPVFNLSVEVGGKAVTSFNGKVKVTLPYTLKAGENTKKLTVYYIDQGGKAMEMQGVLYDEKAGAVVFETDHFSVFAVVYDQNKMIFDDVKEGSWYYDAVNFATNRSLFNGVSDTKFAPDEKMTRAMLVTVLYRMEQSAKSVAGSAVTTSAVITNEPVVEDSAGGGTTVSAGTGEPVKKNVNSFSDVKSGEWYTDAITWADANGIASGIGNGLFGTNNNVTREQLAAILYHYAKYKVYDVTKTTELEAYSDAPSLSSWAVAAFRWANSEALITGRTATTLVPGGSASRAEVATILKRFAEGMEK